MAYDKLSADDVKQWDNDYKAFQDQLDAETDAPKKVEIMRAMRLLAAKVEERLNKDIRTARRYSKTRHRHADKFAAGAQSELKQAKATAAAFRKKPGKTELPKQLHTSIQKIADIEQAFQDDGMAYGAAWFEYRASPTQEVPAKYLATYSAVEATIVNDDKILGVQLQKIIAAKHEAEALLAITDKAAMKAAIKSGAGTRRPIADAQRAAGDLAAQMATLLNLLEHPADASAPPDGITQAIQTLTGASKEEGFLQRPNALTTVRSSWSNVEITYMLMTTKTANMEKVLATKTKGFRSKELADPLVSAELKKAAESVKKARKLVKDKDADYAAAKKAVDKLEAQAKKLKIK